MSRVRLAVVGTFFFLGLLAAPAAAWKGDLAGLVRPIAEVQEHAESGDLVAIEGTVSERRSGHGELIVLRVEDSSGELWVAIPEYVYRDLGNSPLHKRARFFGKWDHKYMDDDTWGIRVQRVERSDAPASAAD
ncbi:MAG: hypothetical protein OEP95_00510 [Myxococcales bacterium]|nr:hypothetical protein [Myxococcales bacterium]